MMDVRPNRMSAIASALAVFAIAVAVRLPSCYQSFWVDELHSAWCVWDSLVDVAPRAKLGNQSPFYFVGLWFWKQAFGGGELALRMSSVLATACSASFLVVGISRLTGSLIAGVASGLVMAIESNAIFFGTELRPYAMVILASTVATLCFLMHWCHGFSATKRGPWIGLVLASLAAVLFQPTAAGVLAWLFLVLMFRRLVRGGFVKGARAFFAITRVDGLLLLATIGVGWMQWTFSIGKTWQIRSDWGAFAKAPSLMQAIGMWDWVWLWFFPLLLLSGHRILRSCCKKETHAAFGGVDPRYGRAAMSAPLNSMPLILSLALVCVASSMVFWLASRFDLVHLWHRRYLITMLPIFAAIVGMSVAAVGQGSRKQRLVAISMALGLLFGLSWSQDVTRGLVENPSRLAFRGEDWRDAIAELKRRCEQAKVDQVQVGVDQGLVDARKTSERAEYGTFVLRGPYRATSNAVLISVDGNQIGKVFTEAQRMRRPQFFLIRRPASSIDVLGGKVDDFGSVSLIEI